jgi:hypothetical protein
MIVSTEELLLLNDSEAMTIIINVDTVDPPEKYIRERQNLSHTMGAILLCWEE